MDLESEEEQEQYVSKISLKGFIEQGDENPENIKQQVSFEKCSEWQKQQNSSSSQEMRQSIRDECNSDMNDSSSKKYSSSMKMRKLEKSKSANLSYDFGQTQQNIQKSLFQPTFSLSFLDNTLDSLSGLSEVLIKQNNIMTRTHPLIRNMVLKSQQNKISYLNQEISFIQKDENDENENGNYRLDTILQNEKKQLQKLTDILQQHIQGLTQYVISEEQCPISTTSIRYRLDRMQTN